MKAEMIGGNDFGVICAWCSDVQAEPDALVSHGICPQCQVKMRQEMEALRARRHPGRGEAFDYLPESI